MPTSPPASTSTATIASARSLPPRVRRVLEAFYTQAANDLSERIGQMLVEVEQQLFKQAEKAYSNEKQAEQFANPVSYTHLDVYKRQSVEWSPADF